MTHKIREKDPTESFPHDISAGLIIAFSYLRHDNFFLSDLKDLLKKVLNKDVTQR
jgi:hypothetical protein